MSAALFVAASWVWELLRGLTVTDWLLILVVFGLWGIASAIRWGVAVLTEAIAPVTEYYCGLKEEHEERDERRRKREMLGDLLKEGVATPADIDQLNRLDAEDPPRYR